MSFTDPSDMCLDGRSSVARSVLIGRLSRLLEPERFKDYGPNGLQVEGRPQVQKIVSGVTASLALSFQHYFEFQVEEARKISQ